jgi:serine/threonine protein kinase
MEQHSKAGLSEKEQRLNRLLYDYLRAIEAGQTPDRQELLKRHPELAVLLGEFFANWDRLEDWFGPLGAVSHAEQLLHYHEQESTEVADAQGNGKSASPQMSALADYQLLKEIARGNRGPVYRAVQTSQNRLVAVKFILAEKLASETEYEKLTAALKANSKLDHPNIVPIYDFGKLESQYYFSMKLIAGTSLDRQIARFSADPKAAANIVATVARAVHYAHERGVVHGDLRPASVLLAPDSRPHVHGFGISDLAIADTGLPPLGAIGRRLCYLSPEQLVGNQCLGPSADVYGLGALLYELVTGQAPFNMETPLQILERVVSSEPIPVKQLKPTAPTDLQSLCSKCLQKERSKRPASALEVAESLQLFLDGKPAVPAMKSDLPKRPPVPAAPRKKRRRQLLAAAAAGVLVAAGLGYYIEHVVLSDLRSERDDAVRQARMAQDDTQSARADREALVRDKELAVAREKVTHNALDAAVQQGRLARAEIEKQRQHIQEIIEITDKDKADAAQDARRESQAVVDRLNREKESLTRRLAESEKSRQNLTPELARRKTLEEADAAQGVRRESQAVVDQLNREKESLTRRLGESEKSRQSLTAELARRKTLDEADAAQDVRRESQAAMDRLNREKDSLTRRLAESEKSRQSLTAELARRKTLDAASQRVAQQPTPAKALVPDSPVKKQEATASLAASGRKDPGKTEPAIVPTKFSGLDQAKEPAKTVLQPVQGQPATTRASQPRDRDIYETLKQGAAQITVLMAPDGDIIFQGERFHHTEQHGNRRLFLTPPLEEDGDFHFYDLRVSWMGADGQRRFRNTMVPVRPGGIYTVDMRPEVAP